MDAVTRCVLAALLATATPAVPAQACGLAQWQPHVADAARIYAVPETWLRAVMRAESAGCTHLDGKPIVSHAGAMGLMQIMPATWAELRARHGFGDDPFDPRENILAGAAYLREMRDRFGVPGAFAAYHAGPGRYAAHLAHGAALPAETRRYQAQVAAEVGLAHIPQAADALVPADPLFAVVRRHGDDGQPSASDPRLFVRLARERVQTPESPTPEHDDAP